MVEKAEVTGRVARVIVDVSLPHLDRLFDYAVPDAMAELVRPGVRVRVRFAGRLRDGWVAELSDGSSVPGRLAPLERVTSGEVVLTPPLLRLARAVADHWCGVLPDVLRLAIAPRHGATEKATPKPRPAPASEVAPAVVLPQVPHGAEFLAALAAGEGVRAAWTPVPVHGPAGDWLSGVLEASAATLTSGRDVVVVVPDGAELARAEATFAARFGPGCTVSLTADVGPAARYRAYLAAVRGDARIVLGTRSAVFTPVRDLGLLVVWDEGNDLYAEPRAPYPHTREVAALRASQEHAALLLAGYHRSAEVQALVERGWLVSLATPPTAARRLAPVVRVALDSDRTLERDPQAAASRLPQPVFAAIRAGLASGPVLVQVPLAGYAVGLACQRCRGPVECPHCRRGLRGEPSSTGLDLVCSHCGPLDRPWRCPSCGDRRLRAPRVGVTRTAEEFGRAFPSVRVAASYAGHVATVDEQPAIVLATPGAEPAPEGGYAAAVVLDADMALSRPDLRAAEESLRRWLTLTALVRPAEEGGTVTLVGDAASRPVQALVRLDPVGFAERELADRRATGFPPAAKIVAIEGRPGVLASYVEAADGVGLFDVAPVVPLIRAESDVDADEMARVVMRSALSDAARLVETVRAVRSVRSARKEGGAVRVMVDPQALA